MNEENKITQHPQELTEQEKMECVVRWLNAGYRHALFPKDFPRDACERCPLLWTRCQRDNIRPQDNFKVMEKYTGVGTTVGYEVHGGL